jgi:tetratricopeptide (TPR) repeat protein
LNQAIKLNEKNMLAYFTRANCRIEMTSIIEQLEQGNNNLVITLGQKTAQPATTPQMPVQDYTQILEDLDICIYLDPKFSFAYFNRAIIKTKQKDYKGAIEDLNRAIEFTPDFAEAYFNRGLTKIYLDDIEGGAVDLSKAGEIGCPGCLQHHQAVL